MMIACPFTGTSTVPPGRSRATLALADAAAAITRRGKTIVLGQMGYDDLDAYVPIAAVERTWLGTASCAGRSAVR